MALADYIEKKPIIHTERLTLRMMCADAVSYTHLYGS